MRAKRNTLKLLLMQYDVKYVLFVILGLLLLPSAFATVLFESNWSTATGNDINTALLDGGIWNNYFCSGIADVLTVIEGNTISWSGTPNVLRVMDAGTQCGMLAREPGLPLSTSHYGRFYFRNDVPESTNNHFATYHAVGRIQLAHWNRQGFAEGFEVFMRVYYQSDGQDNVYPLTRWALSELLNNEQWYRYEWHMEYVTPTTYRIWPRVYDMQNNLIYDAYDFRQGDYGAAQWNGRNDWTLGSYYDAGYTFGFGDVNLARNIGFGQEGPVRSTNSGEYFYFAALRYDDSGWIGPYGVPEGGGEPPQDTTPPTVTITAPTSEAVISAGTTSTALTVTTNEASTCRYGTSDVSFASLPNTLSGAGTMSHSATLTGLADGQSYTYYVRCQDSAENANTVSAQVMFSVAQPGLVGNPVVSVSSTYAGYSSAVIDDGVIDANGETTTTWASSESISDPHWVEFDFGESVAVDSFTIYWADLGGTFLTSQELDVQRWDGSVWQTAGSFTRSSNQASSTVSATGSSSRWRLFQPPNSGNPTYATVMWLTEIDYVIGEGSSLLGDLNDDDSVNLLDVLIVIENFRRQSFYFRADVNGDGVVNVFDLVLVARDFGRSAV